MAQVVRAAATAGTGHIVSTLIIAAIVWSAGTVLAARYGHVMTVLSSAALIVFGAWIALSSWREMMDAHHGHAHSHFGHAHAHRHDGSEEHRHWHEHHDRDWHGVDEGHAPAPLHEHEHATSSRTALLLILGSSPMVEGIPAFFAASRYGPGLLGIMAVVFAASTIAAYIILCAASVRGMQRLNLGRFERYGEILSGSIIVLLGLAFLALPSTF